MLFFLFIFFGTESAVAELYWMLFFVFVLYFLDRISCYRVDKI